MAEIEHFVTCDLDDGIRSDAKFFLHFVAVYMLTCFNNAKILSFRSLKCSLLQSPVHLAVYRVFLSEESKSEGLSRSAADTHEPSDSFLMPLSIDDCGGEGDALPTVLAVVENVDCICIGWGGCEHLL